MTSAVGESPLLGEDLIASFISEGSMLTELGSEPSPIDEFTVMEIINRYEFPLKKDGTVDTEDKTQVILSAFVQHLPSPGKEFLERFIINHPKDEDLRTLAMHFFTAVLTPSKLKGALSFVHEF